MPSYHDAVALVLITSSQALPEEVEGEEMEPEDFGGDDGCALSFFPGACAGCSRPIQVKTGNGWLSECLAYWTLCWEGVQGSCIAECFCLRWQAREHQTSLH